jgi:hypothetical protein
VIDPANAKTKINLSPTQKTTIILTTNPAKGGKVCWMMKILCGFLFLSLSVFIFESIA